MRVYLRAAHQPKLLDTPAEVRAQLSVGEWPVRSDGQAPDLSLPAQHSLSEDVRARLAMLTGYRGGRRR